ncbi:MAG: flagellar filament capping protein FliD [Rubricoccaceae bacterium]
MVSVSRVNANDPYELLISNIIRLERQPQQRLKDQQASQKKQRTVLNDFSTALSGLRAELAKMSDRFANPFAAKQASVPGGAGFTATASGRAAAGAHTLQVERLAAADARVSRRIDTAGTTLRDFFAARGPQTFAIEVGSPTATDPTRRVSVDVTVEPTGSTDGEILGQIRQAVTDALSQAASEGRINRADVPVASVVSETAGTARLQLRAGGTGFDRRLGFADSADGLLARLQIARADLAGGEVQDVTPATSASHLGSAVSTPVSFSILTGNAVNVQVNGAARTVNIANGTYNTPQALAAAFQNALGNDMRVDVEDGALRVTTVATGEASSIRFTGGNALARLGFAVMAEPVRGTDAVVAVTPAGTSGGMLHAVGTSEMDSGLSARFVLDGLTMYRGSNEVTDALQGVTLTLRAPGAPETFAVAPDGTVATEQVEKFIERYNAVVNFIAQRTVVDPEARTRGEFAGDGPILGLRAGMRSDLLRPVAGQPDTARALESLGITTAKDGTLKLSDKAALEAAIAQDPGSVQRLFASGGDGLAERLTARLDAFVGTGGLLGSRKETLEAANRRIEKRIKDWDARLQAREKSLRLQFARLQETVALLQGQQQQFSAYFY